MRRCRLGGGGPGGREGGLRRARLGPPATRECAARSERLVKLLVATGISGNLLPAQNAWLGVWGGHPR